MARIVINEKDLTTATKAPDTTDIVFVPGLMGSTLNNNGEKVKLQGKKYTPTLCQTVTAFENYFGKEPYQFQNDEAYNGIEVEAGDFDPGYIYAKELLAAGLQVVYEALDTDIASGEDTYKVVTEEPADFATTYTNYYAKGSFVELTDWSTVGAYVFKNTNDALTAYKSNTIQLADRQNTANKYYVFKPSTTEYVKIPLTDADANIDITFNATNTILVQDKSSKTSLNSVFAKPSSVTETSNYYIPYNTTAVPDIDDINNIENKATYTGMAYDGSTLKYYKDGTGKASGSLADGYGGLHKDKSGNLYYLSSTGWIINRMVIVANLNTDETGVVGPDPNDTNKHYIAYADAKGILVLNSANSFIKYSVTSSDGSMCLFYAISDEPTDIKVSDGGYIQSLGSIYTKEEAGQQTVLSKIYSQLSTVYHTEVMADSDIPSLSEKGEYSIKYITSGGYPNYGSNIGIYTQMMTLAANRGDAVALVDAVSEKSRTLNPGNEQSLYYELQTKGISNGSFGTMMFPWINVNLLNTYGKNQIEPKTDALMPASFAYLKCLATSLKQGNPNWLSIAGVTRGLVSNLVSDNPIQTDKPVTNAIADYYQGTQPNGDAVSDTEFKYAINAITNIKPYGYCIWGNRTLAINVDGQKATNYLNIRNLVSDIKKICYTSARRLMFEQNDDILWTKFLSYVTPTLDKMNSGSGVSGYKVIKLATDEHAKLAAKIIIFPVYAVENFEITVELKDEEITVEE